MRKLLNLFGEWVFIEYRVFLFSVRTVAGIRRPDIYTLRNFLIALFEKILVDPINHQKAGFTIMTFKICGVSAPQDFFTELNINAFGIA